jgi:hypothetical protein
VGAKAETSPATASARRSPSRANRERGGRAGSFRPVALRVAFPGCPGEASPHNTNRPPDADACRIIMTNGAFHISRFEGRPSLGGAIVIDSE